MYTRKTQAFLLLLSLVVFSPACFKELTKTNVVYFNNFETDDIANLLIVVWNDAGTGMNSLPYGRFSSVNGSRALGKFNNGVVQLNLTNLPPHQTIRAEFDLYVQDQWKGDLWSFAVNGANQLLTSFSTDSTIKQAYPFWIGNPVELGPAGRNAVTNDMPGACSLASSPHGSSQYKVIKTFSSSSPTIQITLNDAGNYLNDTCKRSWSIDNLRVSTFN